MKNILFFLLLFISFSGFSQNYKGVVEGDTTYFPYKFELPYLRSCFSMSLALSQPSFTIKLT